MALLMMDDPTPVSVDEKPGVQAIGLTAPDLPPVPGKMPAIGRDYEYIRRGTVSIMAGIDLHSGHIIANVEDRHRSLEFIALLKRFDEYYPSEAVIRVVLDNHSTHISKETMTYTSRGQACGFSNSWNFGFKSVFTCSLKADFTLSRQSSMASLKWQNVS